MPGRTSIVVRLVSLILLASTVIFALTLGWNYLRSREVLERELETFARALADSLVNKVETHLTAVSKVTQTVATALETVEHDEPQLLELVRATVERNPEIHGAGVAFEPHAFRPEVELYAPFYYRNTTGLRLKRLEETYAQLPYWRWDWYQIPRELGRLEWSEPYYQEGVGSRLMSTCSLPFYQTTAGGERRLRGIVTADVSLEALTRLVSSVKILDTGYAALLSRNGMILAHPLTEAIMNETFFTLAEARGDPWMRELGRKMVRGETGFVLYTSLVGFRSWMLHTPIPSTGWTLAVVFPEDELLANVRALTLTMAAMGLGGVLLLSLALVVVVRRLIGPLAGLAAATDDIAAGNFDVALPAVRSQDEIGRLARDFERMRVSLKDYIRNLTETTAAKERIESELKVATSIQASLLPRVFPPFPEHQEFDVYASMVPAKEVGGDFYDFFLIDQDRLCFLIADVSGKGVPAALYMMVAKTLLKTEGQRLRDPAATLASVNRILAVDNEECMFATVFCAILDVRTGEVRFANAAHNPPLLMSREGVRYLTPPPGLMLGPMPDVAFETHSMQLAPGDVLFLYTDGVTEAHNEAAELYGEQRLLETLQRSPQRQDLRALIDFVRQRLGAHVLSAPQSDDITMLAVSLRSLPTAGAPA